MRDALRLGALVVAMNQSHPVRRNTLVNMILTLSLVACGSSVSAPGDDDGGGGGVSGRMPVLPPTAVSFEGCATPRLVPAGPVWLSSAILFQVDTNSGEVDEFITECDRSRENEDYFANRFRADDMFVDDVETSVACYQQCVDAGACGPPLPPDLEQQIGTLESNLPRPMSREAASSFCAWRGGRLPLTHELIRAGVGDANAVGPAGLGAEYVRCTVGAPCNDDLFGRLEAHLRGQLPVGSVPEDVGPFGHRDLFFGLADIVADEVAVQRLCDAETDAEAASIPRLDDGIVSGLVRAIFASRLLDRPDAIDGFSIASGPSDGSPSIVETVRCAFDPVYEDVEATE